MLHNTGYQIAIGYLRDHAMAEGLHTNGLKIMTLPLFQPVGMRAGLAGRPRAKSRLIPTAVDPFFMGQRRLV